MKILASISHENFSGDYLGLQRVLTVLENSKQSVTAIYYVDPQDWINGNTELFDLYIFSANIRYIELLATIIRHIKTVNPQAYVAIVYPYAITAEDIFAEIAEVDFVLLGNCETYITQLISKIECASISDLRDHPNICFDRKDAKVPFHDDFANLPIPTRSIEDFNKVKFAFVQSSDGCRGKCKYCLNTRDKLGWSGKPVDEIISEIKSIYEKTKQYHYVFVDKSFEDGGKNRIKEFCERVAELPVKLTFRCYLRADSFDEDDLPLLKQMYQSGFTNVMVGIESFCDEDLKTFAKRASAEQNQRFLNLITRAGIHAQIGTILFHPKTTAGNLSYNFCKLVENRVYTISQYISRLFIYKDTPIYKDFAEYIPDYNFKAPTHYYFEDQTVGKIFSFVDTHLINSVTHSYGENIRENIYFFFALRPVLEENEQFYILNSQMDNCISYIVEVIESYFSELYINHDIPRAMQLLPDFEEKIRYAQRRVKAIVMKAMLMFLRSNNKLYTLY